MGFIKLETYLAVSKVISFEDVRRSPEFSGVLEFYHSCLRFFPCNYFLNVRPTSKNTTVLNIGLYMKRIMRWRGDIGKTLWSVKLCWGGGRSIILWGLEVSITWCSLGVEGGVRKNVIGVVVGRGGGVGQNYLTHFRGWGEVKRYGPRYIVVANGWGGGRSALKCRECSGMS